MWLWWWWWWLVVLVLVLVQSLVLVLLLLLLLVLLLVLLLLLLLLLLLVLLLLLLLFTTAIKATTLHLRCVLRILQAIGRYWDDYRARVAELAEAYPQQVRVWDFREVLNDETTQERMLRWLGVTEPVLAVGEVTHASSPAPECHQCEMAARAGVGLNAAGSSC